MNSCGGPTNSIPSGLIGTADPHPKTAEPSDSPHQFCTGQHHVTERAVPPSEIEQLPDLQGYLKFASTAAWRKVQLRIT
jgi:hypothetical protein